MAEGVPLQAAPPSDHWSEAMFSILLRDLNPQVVSAWQAEFADEPFVEVSQSWTARYLVLQEPPMETVPSLHSVRTGAAAAGGRAFVVEAPGAGADAPLPPR